MSSPEQGQDARRSRRFRTRIEADLAQGTTVQRVYSVDVSRHGVFLATPNPPRERFLVRVTLHLPDGPLEANGFVSRRVPPSDTVLPGVGLQFFAMAEPTRRRWEQYITWLSGSGVASDVDDGFATFVIKLPDVEKLRDLVDRALRSSNLYIMTPLLRPVGSAVAVVLVHPESQAEFVLKGKVARVRVEQPRGLEVAADAVPPADYPALGRFLIGADPYAATPLPIPEPVPASDAPRAAGWPGGQPPNLHSPLPDDPYGLLPAPVRPLQPGSPLPPRGGEGYPGPATSPRATPGAAGMLGPGPLPGPMPGPDGVYGIGPAQAPGALPPGALRPAHLPPGVLPPRMPFSPDMLPRSVAQAPGPLPPPRALPPGELRGPARAEVRTPFSPAMQGSGDLPRAISLDMGGPLLDEHDDIPIESSFDWGAVGDEVVLDVDLSEIDGEDLAELTADGGVRVTSLPTGATPRPSVPFTATTPRPRVGPPSWPVEAPSRRLPDGGDRTPSPRVGSSSADLASRVASGDLSSRVASDDLRGLEAPPSSLAQRGGAIPLPPPSSAPPPPDVSPRGARAPMTHDAGRGAAALPTPAALRLPPELSPPVFLTPPPRLPPELPTPTPAPPLRSAPAPRGMADAPRPSHDLPTRAAPPRASQDVPGPSRTMFDLPGLTRPHVDARPAPDPAEPPRVPAPSRSPLDAVAPTPSARTATEPTRPPEPPARATPEPSRSPLEASTSAREQDTSAPTRDLDTGRVNAAAAALRARRTARASEVPTPSRPPASTSTSLRARRVSRAPQPSDELDLPQDPEAITGDLFRSEAPPPAPRRVRVAGPVRTSTEDDEDEDERSVPIELELPARPLGLIPRARRTSELDEGSDDLPVPAAPRTTAPPGPGVGAAAPSVAAPGAGLRSAQPHDGPGLPSRAAASAPSSAPAAVSADPGATASAPTVAPPSGPPAAAPGADPGAIAFTTTPAMAPPSGPPAATSASFVAFTTAPTLAPPAPPPSAPRSPAAQATSAGTTPAPTAAPTPSAPAASRGTAPAGSRGSSPASAADDLVLDPPPSPLHASLVDAAAATRPAGLHPSIAAAAAPTVQAPRPSARAPADDATRTVVGLSALAPAPLVFAPSVEVEAPLEATSTSGVLELPTLVGQRPYIPGVTPGPPPEIEDAAAAPSPSRAALAAAITDSGPLPAAAAIRLLVERLDPALLPVPLAAKLLCRSCEDVSPLRAGRAMGRLAPFTVYRLYYCRPCRRFTSVLRLAPAKDRAVVRAAIADLAGDGPTPHIPIDLAFEVADLARPPRCPTCSSAVRLTKPLRAIELALADLASHPDVPIALDKLTCSRCDRLGLVLELDPEALDTPETDVAVVPLDDLEEEED